MRIAVVGAGWAGMAGALYLASAGHDVVVLEAAPTPGGRARGLQDKQLGWLDNGQHILIGAYTDTLALTSAAHGELSDALLQLPLSWIAADNSIHLRANDTQSTAISRLVALGRAQGLSARERLNLVTWLARVKLGGARAQAGDTVTQWLDRHGIAVNTRVRLLTPLCLATMNTSPDDGCALLFERVLQDSLLNTVRGACDMLVARCDLTELWMGPLADQVDLRCGHRVQTITPTDTGVSVDGEQFDGCLVAGSAHETLRLAQSWHGPQSTQLTQTLATLCWHSITTCYLELEQPLTLPQPVLMLASGHPDPNGQTYSDQPGHWVFDRNALCAPGEAPPRARLAFVCSHAGEANIDRHKLAQQLLTQLITELQKGGHNVPANLTIHAQRILTDRRATFAATPRLSRPDNLTDWPTLTVAGDWTDTGYPGVLEGAVRSGQQAAQHLLQNITHKNP